MQDKLYHTPLAKKTLRVVERGIVREIPYSNEEEYESETALLAPRGGALELPTARQTVIYDQSSEVERSTAFVRFTIPLSIGMAALTFVASLVGGLAALVAVGAAFAAFAAAWLAALVYYVSRSPAGTARHDANEAWKAIKREQQHRHEVAWFILEKTYGKQE